MPLNPLEVTGGLAIGEGVGGAIAATVEPRLQGFKNKQWGEHQDKPLDPAAAAAAEQQGYDGNLSGITDASYSGIDGDRYLALRYLAATAPGTPELLELWRRGKLGPDLVRAGLKKAGLMDEFIEPVMELFTGRLDPAVIATAIQRGIMHDPGFLPVSPPTGSGNVPAFPVSPLDPIEEAKAHGIDSDRLFVETAIIGLPASVVEAAQAYFRGIGTLDDYYRAVSEGNVRNEWRDLILEVSRQILTANQYAELQLRGYITEAQRRAKTAQHGMSQADSDLLYDLLGRGVNVHQVLIGARRGGVYNGPTDQIPAEYLASLRRGNLRPEFYNLAYAGRESYPSAFVTRGLLTAGAITIERGKELFSGLGWPQDVADSAAETFGVTTTAKTDGHVTKAQTQLWTTLHRSYLAGESSEQEIAAGLPQAGVDTASVADVLAVWDAERSFVRKQLSPAQVKKAYGEKVTNPETGVAWTKDDALAALIGRGYSPADAQTFLEL